MFSQTKMKQLHNTKLINHYTQQKIKRLGIYFSNMIYTFYFLKYYITIVTMKCCKDYSSRTKGTFWKRTETPVYHNLHFWGKALSARRQEKKSSLSLTYGRNCSARAPHRLRKQKSPFYHPMVTLISGGDITATEKYMCGLLWCNYIASCFSSFTLWFL